MQRAGRAGRVRPGHAFRLCTEESWQQLLPDASVPEMQRSDLAGLLLQLKVRVGLVYGVCDCFVVFWTDLDHIGVTERPVFCCWQDLDCTESCHTCGVSDAGRTHLHALRLVC